MRSLALTCFVPFKSVATQNITVAGSGECLCHARTHLRIVSGKISVEGDPHETDTGLDFRKSPRTTSCFVIERSYEVPGSCCGVLNSRTAAQRGETQCTWPYELCW